MTLSLNKRDRVEWVDTVVIKIAEEALSPPLHVMMTVHDCIT